MNEKEPAKTRHTFQLTITHILYKKLKAEQSFHIASGTGGCKVRHGVISKLLETIEKGYKSVELTYEGD